MRKFTMSVARCRQNLENVLYPDVRTITDLADLAAAAKYDHVPAHLLDNSRARIDGKPNGRFLEADVIAMDCDNTHTDDPAGWKTPADLQAVFPDAEFCIVYSKSHMKEKNGKAPRPKWHCYFALAEPITDADTMKRRKKQLQQLFPEFDPGATDAVRVLSGVENPQAEAYDGGKCIDEIWPPLPDPAEAVTMTSGSGTTPTITGGALADYPDGVKEGGRHTALCSFALAALKAHGDDAYNLVIEKNRTYCPPLGDREVQEIWRDEKRFYDTSIRTSPTYTPPGQHSPEWEAERQRMKEEYRKQKEAEYLDAVNSLTDADCPERYRYDMPPTVDPATGEIIEATGGGAGDQAGSPADPTAINWPALNDFEKPLSDQLPPFPVDALPPVQREYVLAVAANTSTDPCLCAAEVLAAGASALQGVVRVEPEAGWRDNATCLWVLNILESGGGKSLVTNEIQSHLHAWQQELNERMQDARIDAEARYLYAKSRLEGLTAAQKRPNSKIKVKAKDIIDARRALKEATDGLVQEVKLTTGNTTVERLVQIMREQTNHRVTVIADEAGVIGTWTGRYNDGVVEVSAPCTAYSGGNVDDGRIRGDRTVYGAHLCVILCGQWKVLTDTIQNEKLVDQGFTARFLYTFPRNMEPPPDADLTEEQRHVRKVPEDVAERFRTSLFDIFEVTSPTVIPGKKIDPKAVLDFDSEIGDGEDEGDKIAYPEVKTIHFSAEAEYLWTHDILDDDRRKKAETAGETPHMTAWMKRYRSTVARIAAVLHAYKLGGDLAAELLDVDTLADAWRIAQYFFEAARAGFLYQKELPLTADAKYVWQKIRTAEPDAEGRITNRDLWHKRCHSKFKGVREGMDAALDELQRRGYIKRERISTGGRPGEILHVNPAALGDGGGPR